MRDRNPTNNILLLVCGFKDGPVFASAVVGFIYSAAASLCPACGCLSVRRGDEQILAQHSPLFT